uniref:Mitogen-activated protein kinase kinase kinase N-terminal domain-containing protein n=1 Tax=Seriola lalandi dorsalis TaxID=1841481 RepID=A0A3B4WPL4_SERLL
EEEALYGTSPPYTPRQIKRMSGKHQRNSQARSAGRSPNKESPRPVETPEEHSYKQGKKQRATLRSTERDHKKTFEGSFMLDPLSKSSPFGALNMDPRKHYLSLGCSSGKLPVSMPHIARPHRQTSRTDCPADRLKFFETLRLLLKLTSMSSKRKEKEQRGLENMAFMGHNNEVIWLELQAWHARRSTGDQDLFLFTARQAIPDIINEVLHFKVNYDSLRGAHACPSTAMNAAEPLGSGADCREHLQRQRLAFEQVKRVMELLESVEALYPSLQALQKDYEKYAARDFQGRVQALCLWLNITQDLNQKLRVMATVLGLHDLSRIGWPVFEIPSPRCSRGNEEEENEKDEENDSTATFTAESEGEDRDAEEDGGFGYVADGELSPQLTPKFARLLSEDEFLPTATSGSAESTVGGGVFCPTAIYRPFVDKALKQMGLRKLILRLHKLMDRSLQRSRAALLRHTPALEVRV